MYRNCSFIDSFVARLPEIPSSEPSATFYDIGKSFLSFDQVPVHFQYDLVMLLLPVKKIHDILLAAGHAVNFPFDGDQQVVLLRPDETDVISVLLEKGVLEQLVVHILRILFAAMEIVHHLYSNGKYGSDSGSFVH